MLDRPDPPPTRAPSARWLPLPLLALGAALRLIQYFSDRPLWYDEAMLANNILARSFAELAGPLGDAQIAPVGFLYLVKTATVGFGTSEHALRLVPLAMGLATLALFWGVASRVLPRPAALLALVLLAVSPRLIYYSAEVKQYSGDVAVGLAIVLVALEARRRSYEARWIGWLAALGVVGVWVSQPSVFVLGGVLLALSVDRALERDGTTVARLALAGVACMVSFGGSFAVARSALAGSEVLPTFWTAGFLPLPPTSMEELQDWAVAFARPFRDPLSFTVPLAGLAAYLLGIAAIARRAGALPALALTAPIFLTMLAAGLHLYPYGDEILHGGRVILFLAPLILIPVAAGAEVLLRRVGITGAGLALVIAAGLVVPRVLAGPIETFAIRSPLAGSLVVAPPVPPIRIEMQDPRPVIGRMAEHTRAEDVIYVYSIAGPAFRYYAPRSGIRGQWMRGAASGNDLAHVAAEVEALRGHPRAWLFFAYAHGGRAVPFLDYAGTLGEPVQVLEEGGVGALLYDFSGTPATFDDTTTLPSRSSP
jgi:hypothetical protein